MKIAFYLSHHESLGHTTRAASILGGLKARFGEGVEMLVINAGVEQPQFGLGKYGDVVRLPFGIRGAFRMNFERVRAGMDTAAFRGIVKKRISIMKRALTEFRPDAFVTEFFPFGRHAWHLELPPVLDFVKRHTDAKAVCSIGYPAVESGTKAALEKYYDFVMFHCMERDIEEYGKTLESRGLSGKEFMGILDALSGKSVFTNYVLDRSKPAPRHEVMERLGFPEGDRLVVVSRGGGTRKPDITPACLRASRLMGDGGNGVRFLVSAGPATGSEAFKLYSSVAGKLGGVKLVDYLPDFTDYLNAADLSINMAGYNTSVRLLWLKKQNICIPALNVGKAELLKEKEISIEQLYRANMMEGLGISKQVSPLELSGAVFRDAITDMLEHPLRPSTNMEDLRFDGVENTVKALERVCSS